MEGTRWRRIVGATVLLLLLTCGGLLVTSGKVGYWIRTMDRELTDHVQPIDSTSRCCVPHISRSQSTSSPSLAAVGTSATVNASDTVSAASALRTSWPDCPDAVLSPPKGSQTTEGGCLLDDAHNFLYGRGVKGAIAPELLRKCDAVPPGLVGPIRVFQCKACIADLEALDFHVGHGGHYRPRHCNPSATAAIIIPFRNRWQHLSDFLLNMHPLLQKQEMDYTIYVINQLEGSKFNRGMLFNVGAVESSKIRSYSCYIFHDVDLLPESDKNLYRCPTGFHHYSVAVDKLNYRLPYDYLVGGVLAADKIAFERVNGYSNLFFGWGGEDDDFSKRISTGGFHIERFSADVSRYKMIKHGPDAGNEVNPQRWDLLHKTSSRIRTDGLNSLAYTVVDIKYAKLFTLVNVAINQQDVMNKFSGVAAQARKRG